jgi:hypothetical protein
MIEFDTAPECLPSFGLSLDIVIVRMSVNAGRS